MRADAIRPGTILGGKRVVRASNGVASFRVAKSAFSRAARCVTFDDGTRAAFELGRDVDAIGYTESLPAGNVQSRHVKTPHKVSFDPAAGRWRGESVRGKLSTREHDLIAKTNMFDAGRVNGHVGSRVTKGVSTRLTGPSF